LIRYLAHKEIDKTKWDNCIDESCNQVIYAKTFWLDEMCKWDALVLNNYEAVMPLTWNRKYGFYYLYQPYFTKQLGVFAKTITPEMVNAFLSAIPAKFKLWDIDLMENCGDEETWQLKKIVLKKRTNYFLQLDESYGELYKNYKRLSQRMLQKAKENEIILVKNADPIEAISFYKKNYNYDKNISENIYTKLYNAVSIAFTNKQAYTYLAKTKQDEIIGAYIILKDEENIYSLIGGSNKKGKEVGAFYLLTDAVIKDNTDSKLTFRFEGSDKKGIAFFNSQFGALPVEYFHLYYNNLPWPLSFLK
jgi:hypothetical protein